MVNHQRHSVGDRPATFVHTPDVASLLRKEGVDVDGLTTRADLKKAIAGLSEDARKKITGVLSPIQGRDVDELCEYPGIHQSDR